MARLDPNVLAPAFGWFRERCSRPWQRVDLTPDLPKELDAMVSTVLSRDVPARDWDSAPLVSRHGERVVVWLEGEQDIATVAALAETLAKVTSADDADLIVDLSGVTFMSTATIDELIRARDLLLRQSRTLTLRSPSRCARRLIDYFQLAALVGSTVAVATPRNGPG